MNILSMTAGVVSAPRMSTATDGTAKTAFLAECSGGLLALRFSCLCFGTVAAEASRLAKGDRVALSGRLVASAQRSTTLIVNFVELNQKEEEKSDESKH